MHHFQGCRASLKSLCLNFGGELSTIATLMFVMLHMLFKSSALLSLDQKYPSTLTWIYKYPTLCNALFSRMKSILVKFMHQFWGWAVHHCYTNVRNAAQQLGTEEYIVKSYHLYSREYLPLHIVTSMSMWILALAKLLYIVTFTSTLAKHLHIPIWSHSFQCQRVIGCYLVFQITIGGREILMRGCKVEFNQPFCWLYSVPICL